MMKTHQESFSKKKEYLETEIQRQKRPKDEQSVAIMPLALEIPAAANPGQSSIQGQNSMLLAELDGVYFRLWTIKPPF
jgi:hypothetical protein